MGLGILQTDTYDSSMGVLKDPTELLQPMQVGVSQAGVRQKVVAMLETHGGPFHSRGSTRDKNRRGGEMKRETVKTRKANYEQGEPEQTQRLYGC